MTVPTPLLSIAAPEKRSELMSCLKFGSSLADSQTDDDQAKKQTDDDQAKSLSQVCLKFVSILADSQTDDDQVKNLTNRNLRRQAMMAPRNGVLVVVGGFKICV